MAAKGISTGIEHLLQKQKATEKMTTQLSKQWKEIRNRIDAILMSNNVMKSTELRQSCFALDQLNQEDRVTHISQHWGPLYLQRVQPLLQQLSTIESQLLKHG